MRLKTTSCHALILLCISVLSISSGNVMAEARRDAGAADPVRKMQYMLRQLSQEKSRLESDNARLNAELKQQAEEQKKLQAKLDKLEKKLDKSKESNQKLVSRVKQDNERMKEMIAKYKETVEKLRTANRDNQLLVNAVTERNQWIEQCQAKNTEMYALNVELLERYRNKDFSDDALEKEVFTGLVAVKLENQEQEYRFRLEDLQTPRFRPEPGAVN